MSDLKDPRVLFAAERTLLAWNRTSLALIAFGFLIERSGLMIKVLMPNSEHAMPLLLTFIVGLGFILLGMASALYSSKQYIKVLKTLNDLETPAGYTPKWGVVVNVVVALLGGLLLVALFIGR